jgi:putative addiction module CopG family antidote
MAEAGGKGKGSMNGLSFKAPETRTHRCFCWRQSYGSASDVVRAGLRLLEEQEVNVKALQGALIACEQSGAPRPFDNSTFLEWMPIKHVR